MYNSGESLYRHNFTKEECREYLERDIAEFGSRFTLLSRARQLLEVQEHEELVRDWFDCYMSIYDENSYDAVSSRLEKLEMAILKAWYTEFRNRT